jgi:hypothetical protein
LRRRKYRPAADEYTISEQRDHLAGPCAGEPIMFEFLSANPWLVIPSLALLIPIVAIVFGSITGYLVKVRRAELEASLKQEMLQRGMSADEIRTVIEASGYSKNRSCARDSAERPEVA